MCPWLCWWGLGGGGGGLAVRVGWVLARLVENPGWLLRRSSFVVVVVRGCCMFCFGYFVVGVVSFTCVFFCYCYVRLTDMQGYNKNMLYWLELQDIV